MEVVGTYMRALRQRSGMTVLEIANAAGTNPTYVWRIENGELESPGIELLSKLITVLRGRGDHLIKLMTDDNPSHEMAEALAKEALTPEEQKQVQSFLANDEEEQIFFESVMDVIHNPKLRGRVQGYLDSVRGGGVPPEPEPQKTSRRRRRA